MNNIVGRLQSLFSQHQIDVIIGSLLGDARLECRSIGIRNPITARLRIHQSDKQKEYVFWKYKIFENLVSGKPRKIKAGYDSKRNINHYSWYFHTRSLKELGLLHHYLYQDGKKIISKDIFKFITPTALAVWFMDDGSNTKQSFTLNTHCFSIEEQGQIVEFLKNQFCITATMIKDRDKFKIRIGRNDYKRFISIIEPFIIPSMIYKIVNPRNDFVEQSTGVRECEVITS